MNISSFFGATIGPLQVSVSLAAVVEQARFLWLISTDLFDCVLMLFSFN